MAVHQINTFDCAKAQGTLCVLAVTRSAEHVSPSKNHAGVIAESMQLVKTRYVSLRTNELPIVGLGRSMSGKPLLGTKGVPLHLSNALVHSGPCQCTLNNYDWSTSGGEFHCNWRHFYRLLRSQSN